MLRNNSISITQIGKTVKEYLTNHHGALSLLALYDLNSVTYQSLDRPSFMHSAFCCEILKYSWK